jgi:arylsulfatase A-like enzyme/Flp pilus assembly protein TadD
MRRAALAIAVLATACGRKASPPADTPKASVLLVTIDTLRADRVGAYGARDARTPHLDALAGRGVLFEEALSSAPLTLPSHATILSGLDPVHHGVRDNGTYVFPEGRDTLATLLKAQGHATGGFVGAYVLDRRFGLARGFDAYDDVIERRQEGASVLESERPCDAVVDAATAWLTGVKRPFLAWVHLYDPHAPYDPPSPFREQFAGRPYDGEIAHADACVGRLLAALPDAQRTLAVVLSDHGEGRGDHGESTHGLFVYQSTLRVPFIMAGPGVPAGRRIAGMARTVDVVPTVLGRLGLDVPHGLDGTDLLSGAPPSRESYAETLYPLSLGWAPLFSLRVGALKYIDAPRAELYDLAADPREAHDVASARPADVARLRQALAALRKDDRPQAGRTADAETAERLRALGYAAGGPPPVTDMSRLKDPKDALPQWHLFEQANAAEALGDREAALRALRELVAREPRNATFRRSLSSALRRAGRSREAVAALGELEAIAPEDAVAWHERAVALAVAGQVDEAIRSEQRATALNPLLPEPFNHLGLLLAQRGRMSEALRAFDAATRLDPNNAPAWNNRGNALRAAGRAREAEEAYRTAARLAPRDVDPLNGLGVIAVEQGRLDEAGALFRRVLELRPDYADAQLNLAFVEARLGRTRDARQRLLRLLESRPPAGLAQRAQRLLGDLPAAP